MATAYDPNRTQGTRPLVHSYATFREVFNIDNIDNKTINNRIKEYNELTTNEERNLYYDYIDLIYGIRPLYRNNVSGIVRHKRKSSKRKSSKRKSSKRKSSKRKSSKRKSYKRKSYKRKSYRHF
jgi:hypothetical protein